MHRGLSHWPRTGVVYDTNVDYVCPPYTGSRGDNLDNNPQAYGAHRCLWAEWLLGEKQSQTLTVWSCAGRQQAKGLLHRTSIAGYFPQYQKKKKTTEKQTTPPPKKKTNKKQKTKQNKQSKTKQNKTKQNKTATKQQTNKQTNKTRMDTNTKTRSPQRNGDHAQGSRRRLVSPSPTRRKQKERWKTQIRTGRPEA